MPKLVVKFTDWPTWMILTMIAIQEDLLPAVEDQRLIWFWTVQS